MLVSALSVERNNGFIMPRFSMGGTYRYYGSGNVIDDTSFNSLNSFYSGNVSAEKLSRIYKDINDWQNFCHKQILNGKLDVIA